ncbi:MAG: hypothetical protein ACR2I2_00710 [Bryobacteraceae bacterium]
MPKRKIGTDPIITVKIQKGLADRYRLPLADVIAVLQEVRHMMAEVGREIQREQGFENPTGDFGLELIAGTDGIAFRKGSIQAKIAVTRDISNGLLAASRVLDTVDTLDRKNRPQITSDRVDASVVRRLERIAKIQAPTHTEMRLVVSDPSKREIEGVTKNRNQSATFGARGARAVESLRAASFIQENLILYGKLFRLKDKKHDEGKDTGFWGELWRDNGEKWRVKFKSSDLRDVTALFRRQVMLQGKAFHYATASPKIIATTITEDADRDYQAAMDDLFGSEDMGDDSDLDSLIRQMHGVE